MDILSVGHECGRWANGGQSSFSYPTELYEKGENWRKESKGKEEGEKGGVWECFSLPMVKPKETITIKCAIGTFFRGKKYTLLPQSTTFAHEIKISKL